MFSQIIKAYEEPEESYTDRRSAMSAAAWAGHTFTCQAATCENDAAGWSLETMTFRQLSDPVRLCALWFYAGDGLAYKGRSYTEGVLLVCRGACGHPREELV